MAVTESAGADRARSLLNGIPDRFNEFCHMDQITFVQLADWMVANVESQISEPCISIEESLFVFLDIVAQGSSFRSTAYGWNHDVKLTQGIFLNVMHALHVLREKEQFSSSCPKFNANKSRWRVTRGWRPGKSRMDGMIKIGDENGDGLDVSKEDLIQALTTLNNFIHDYREF